MDPVLARSAPTDWVYLGEGGAHVIFRYRGTNPALQGRAMRLVKTDGAAADAALRNTWAAELLPQLVPASLLATPTPTAVDSKWTRAVVTPTELMRPAERRAEGKPLAESVDYGRPAQLMDDLTCGMTGQKVLAIEIKPKWGFLPQAQHLHPPESIPIKTRNCRFCLHQHHRGEDVDGTVYCPIDLYSTDRSRVRKALDGLWAQWHSSAGDKNNLRVYVDGKMVLPPSAELIPTAHAGDLSDGTADFLIPLLEKSSALQQLKQLQSTLDATNISDLARQHSEAYPGNKPFESVAEPTAAELSSFVKLYLADPTAGARSPDAWTLRQREIAFMLSAIFKDCSMIVRAVLRNTGAGYELDEARSVVKIIDTDLKPLTNLGKWHALDEKLWRHWAETKGSEEQTVVISAEPEDSPHHSYHNLSRTAGATLAAAGGVYAMHGSPNPDDSSARSIASIDAANTALASAIPDVSPSPVAEAHEDIEPEVRAAIERFSPDLGSERTDRAGREVAPEAPALLTESIVPAFAHVPLSASVSEPSKAEAAVTELTAGEVPALAQPVTRELETTPGAPAVVDETAAPTALEVLAPAEPEATEATVVEQAEAELAAAVDAKDAPEMSPPAVLKTDFAPVEAGVPAFVEAKVEEEVAEPAASEATAAPDAPATPTVVETAPAPPLPAAVEAPSSSTDKKAGFGALALTGVAAGVAGAAAATISKDSRSPSTTTMSSAVKPSPSSGSLSPEVALRRKTSDLEGKSRVARISSLFNRRASQNQNQTSPIKPLKPTPPPKSPRRDKEDGFAARFRKPKKSGASPTTPTSPSAAAAAGVGAGAVAAAAAAIALKEDKHAAAETKEAKEAKSTEAAEAKGTEETIVKPQEEPETKEAASESEVVNEVRDTPLKATEVTTQSEPVKDVQPETEQVVEIAAEPKAAEPAMRSPAVEDAPSEDTTAVAAPEIAAAPTAVKEEVEEVVQATAPTETVATEASPESVPAPVEPIVPFVEAAETAQPAAELATELTKEAEEVKITRVEADRVVALAPVTETQSEAHAPAEVHAPSVETAASAAVESETYVAALSGVSAAAPVEAPRTIELADDVHAGGSEPPAATEATVSGSPVAGEPKSEIARELSDSPHTPAMPIRETFSSPEYTPASPYTPARLARQGSLTAPKAGLFPRLSAFGDDLRIASPDLANLRQSPPMFSESPLLEGPTIVPTKSVESPTESPLRKADTTFPRLSAFIDKDTPGLDALRALGESEIPSMPTPIKEESRSLQPSPNVATFAESSAPIKTPPLDAFGITAGPVVTSSVAAAAAHTNGDDSDASSLQAPSDGRQKRSGAPSPSPQLASVTTEPYEAELGHVAEEQTEPAADESQLLGEAIDLSSPAKSAAPTKVDPTATTPDHVDRYENAALPPLPPLPQFPHARTESVASTVDSMSNADFATAPVSPFRTPTVSTDSLGLRAEAAPPTPRARAE
ncbi:uncharacterized protein COLE_03925 [Cutaneotrichosporon oleaginosum]|nr:hypothetical protein COLE_03925 [Cutaneotrichosporon oleaginosum]